MPPTRWNFSITSSPRRPSTQKIVSYMGSIHFLKQCKTSRLPHVRHISKPSQNCETYVQGGQRYIPRQNHKYKYKNRHASATVLQGWKKCDRPRNPSILQGCQHTTIYHNPLLEYTSQFRYRRQIQGWTPKRSQTKNR